MLEALAPVVSPMKHKPTKKLERARPDRGSPERRDALLDAALSVLSAKSIIDVTVDDIVQAAGVARGTFYIYFADKYDLLVGLAERHHEELFSETHVTIDRGARAFDRLRLSLRRVVASWLKYGGLYRSTTQMALTRPDFLELNQRLRLEFIEKIRSDIDSSLAKDHARPIDSAVAAKALAAMMDWFCLLWIGLNEPPYAGAERDIDHVVDNLALLWYRALYGHDPSGVDVMEIACRPGRGSLDGLT